RASGIAVRSLAARQAFGRRHVAPARPRRHAGLLHLHVELVLLTVERGGIEADRVEAVQLLNDARERRPQVVGLLQLEIAAAGFLGQLFQPTIRTRALHPPWRQHDLRFEADRVDHDVLLAGVVERAAEAPVAGRIVAVGEGHYDFATV